MNNRKKDILLPGEQEWETEKQPFPAAVTDGRYVYISSLCPVDYATGETPYGIRAQTAQALENLFSALKAAGSGPEELLKIDVTLSDLRSVEAVNEVYARLVPKPYPARTCRSANLRHELIQLDAVALVTQNAVSAGAELAGV